MLFILFALINAAACKLQSQIKKFGHSFFSIIRNITNLPEISRDNSEVMSPTSSAETFSQELCV